MSVFIAGEHRVALSDFVALAGPSARLALSQDARARIARSREIVAALASGPAPVYGLNTGVGGNLGFRIESDRIVAFQDQLVVGRTIGVGELLPREACRAALAARVLTAARGTSGLSEATIDALIALYNAGITPAIPAFGSIGAADLGLNAHMAAVLIGRGRAWVEGELLPGAEALARAGLAPVALAAKDGLGLLNNLSVTNGLAAVILAGLGDAMLVGAHVAALAFEGYAANPSIFDPRLQAAHPSAGQVEAAAVFRSLLAGSTILARPNRIQDALCFRTLAPQFGAAFHAFAEARRELEVDLNGVQDTPLVLIDEGDMLSSPNFHTIALSLAYDTLSLAVAQLATASAYRVIKLMMPALSGLPAYLSPVGGASAGYVSTQKLAAALHAEVRLHAAPASLDALAVSDTVEDLAPQTMLCLRKLGRQLEPYRLLLGLEALVAAQAVDLRDGVSPGEASRSLHAAIRARVPMLREDREPGPDIEAVVEALFATATIERATALAAVDRLAVAWRAR